VEHPVAWCSSHAIPNTARDVGPTRADLRITPVPFLAYADVEKVASGSASPVSDATLVSNNLKTHLLRAPRNPWGRHAQKMVAPAFCFVSDNVGFVNDRFVEYAPAPRDCQFQFHRECRAPTPRVRSVHLTVSFRATAAFAERVSARHPLVIPQRGFARGDFSALQAFRNVATLSLLALLTVPAGVPAARTLSSGHS